MRLLETHGTADLYHDSISHMFSMYTVGGQLAMTGTTTVALVVLATIHSRVYQRLCQGVHVWLDTVVVPFICPCIMVYYMHVHVYIVHIPAQVTFHSLTDFIAITRQNETFIIMR